MADLAAPFVINWQTQRHVCDIIEGSGVVSELRLINGNISEQDKGTKEIIDLVLSCGIK